MREIKVFSGRAHPALAESICLFLTEECGLNVELGGCSLNTFPDGEFHCKIEDVRGRDVFLVQPTCPPVNDNIMELLIMIDTCRRASAERITVVCPLLRLCPTRPQRRGSSSNHRQIGCQLDHQCGR